MTVAAAYPAPVAEQTPRFAPGENKSALTGQGQTTRHIPALDGIRGLAIIGVLCAHLFGGEWRNIPVLDQLCRFLAMGWMGVDLFFVLSGFLITGILIDARDKPSYFRNFYGRRAVRIFPLYYGILIIGLLAGQVGLEGRGQWWLWCYLVNLQIALANSMHVPATGWLRLAQFWSLAVEEHFYLVWPVIVLLCPPRWLIRLALTLAAMSLVSRSIFVLETGRTIASYVLTPFRLDGLLIGAACAAAMKSPANREILRRAAMPVLTSCTALVLTTFLLADWNQYTVVVATAGYTFLSIAFASLIVATLTRGSDHWLRQLTESPLLRFFGKYSYGMYAYHMTLLPPILAAVSTAMLPLVHSETAAALLAKPVAFAAVVATALASWHLYEKWWLRLKRFF